MVVFLREGKKEDRRDEFVVVDDYYIIKGNSGIYYGYFERMKTEWWVDINF